MRPRPTPARWRMPSTGADAVFGLSAKGAFTDEMIRSMAPNPIIFAMANPDPEITPEEVARIRDDVIIATGRSDYPNQVNNVLGFPYIFRGALDVQATTINMEMKIAAAAGAGGARPRGRAGRGRRRLSGHASALRARIHHPGAVRSAPDPHDPDGGGEGRHGYAASRAGRSSTCAPTRRSSPPGAIRSPARSTASSSACASFPKRVVFAEGEEEQVIRAAISFVNQGLGKAILVGREDRIHETASQAGIELEGREGIEIHNARLSHRNATYAQFLYERLQRKGYPVPRLPAPDQPGPQPFRRLHGGAGRCGRHGDGRDAQLFDRARRRAACASTPSPATASSACRSCLARGRTVLVADTAIHEMPSAQELAEIAIEVRRRRAPPRLRAARGAPVLLDLRPSEGGARGEDPGGGARSSTSMRVDFEYDGEMSADVALNRDVMAQYPFCRLTGPANVLVMPAFHSASISTKMLQELGGAMVLGPLVVGLDKPVQIVSLGATDNDIVNMAALAAYNIGG